MNNIPKEIISNLIFIFQFLAIVVLLIVIAYAVEKSYYKLQNTKRKILDTKKLTMIGLFSAISTILMLFEVPLPFAPPFYKIDLSELPVLIIGFAYGPVAGILTEFSKIILKVIIRSTTTAFVGELANFVIGASLILPASIIYLFNKNKKSALLGCISGTAVMTVFGSVFNAVYLLPKFAAMYGIPLDSLVAIGTAINSNINSVESLVLFCVVPLNLIKGGLVSYLSIMLYKRISNTLKF